MDPNEFAEFLKELLDRGFTLPIHFAVIAANGATFVARYTADVEQDGLACEIVAEHHVDGMMQLPINMMFVDTTGEAARIVFEATGERRWVN
jgi:hypothetical protein